MPQLITAHDLERWFAYHPLRPGQRERCERIRNGAYQLARLIYEVVPPGDDQAEALRKLREAMASAHEGISLEGPTQSAYFARKFARRRVDSRFEVDDYTRDPEEDDAPDEPEDDDDDGGDSGAEK